VMPVNAQFDPQKIYVETPLVAARFPNPKVDYPTPSLQEGRNDFASHQEALDYLASLARASSGRLSIETIGQSQQGRAIPMARLSARGEINPALPTVLIVAQQHGNEPASGEAALALAQQLSGPRADLLNGVNVLIVPRGNVDGAARFSRATQTGVDMNRDHLLLRTPEAQALANVARKYQPQVVLDLHEFTVAGRWIDKFSVIQKYDALIQAASVGNLSPELAEEAKRYIAVLQRRWGEHGLNSFDYHTTSPIAQDKVVSMGGVQPDTGRNVSALRPSVSLLLEVRGVGIGRAHLLRRVHTAVVAGLTVAELAGQGGGEVRQLVKRAEQSIREQACQGEAVISASHSTSRKAMVFLDVQTGLDKPLDVDWRSAEPLDRIHTRTRPCGYLLSATQSQALSILRQLGVQMLTVTKAQRVSLEGYQLTSLSETQRQDARGAIDDGEGGSIRRTAVRTLPAQDVVAPDTVYVPLDQPLAGLIIAALEPDTQSSFFANRLLDLESGQLRRVMSRPRKVTLKPH
jgi:Zinc carboxypeptidase